MRTGLPYSAVDVLENYVGSTERPTVPDFFLVRPEGVSRIPPAHAVCGHSDKRKIRLGVYALNLTNHYNPDEVYNSVASPQFGQFAGNHHRIAGLVIDIVN